MRLREPQTKSRQCNLKIHENPHRHRLSSAEVEEGKRCFKKTITKMGIQWHNTNGNFAKCTRHRHSVILSLSSTYCAINPYAVVAGKARKEENAAAFCGRVHVWHFHRCASKPRIGDSQRDSSPIDFFPATWRSKHTKPCHILRPCERRRL